jgi:hypothetical protein
LNANGVLDANEPLVGMQQLGAGQTSYSIAVPLIPNMANEFLINVTDRAGNVSTTVDVPTITEDSIAPAVPTVGSPASPTTVNGGTTTLTGTAEAGSLVRVYRDLNGDGMLDPGEPVVGTQQLGAGQTAYSINVPLLRDANNEFLVSSTDAAGNESVADVPTITQDSIAPAVPTLSSPNSPQTVLTSVTISGTVEPNSLVKVYKDANDNGIIDANDTVVGQQQLTGGATNFSIDVPVTAGPANKFLVAATDVAGNESSPIVVPAITRDPFFDQNTGAVTIPGTPGNDAFSVVRNGDNLVVTVNGDTRTYPFSRVTSLNLATGEGDDVVTLDHSGGPISPAPGGLVIDTGSGNDTINNAGGEGSDQFAIGTDSYSVNGGGSIRIRNGEAVNFDGKGGNDLFTVSGLSIPTNLLGGNGDDSFVITNPSLGAPLSIDGGSQINGDSLVVPAQTSDTFVPGSDGSSGAFGTAPNLLSFTSIESLPSLTGDGTPTSGIGATARFNGGHVVIVGSDNQIESSFFAFEGYEGTTTVDRGDINADGVTDTVVAAGAGSNSHIKVFDGKTGALLRSFFAFPDFQGITSIAVADVDGDRFADLVVGASDGVRGHVKVFSGKDGSELFSFYALPDAPAGVVVAAGDTDGDGKADLIVSAAGKPTASVFSGADRSLLATLTPFQGYQGGLSLGASDVDGDGKFEILFGVSVGGSQVKAIGVDGTEKRSFSAFDGFLGGVTVGTNTAGDIVVGAGPGSGPHVKVIDGKSMDLIQSFFAFDEEYTGGIDVS